MTASLRIAVIADIHGNADALTAVLAAIRAEGIERIYNLGDMLSGPLDPAGTAAILRTTPMVSIRGNHDRHLLYQMPTDMIPTDRVTYEALSAEDLAWLATVPETRQERDVFLCHGTPSEDERYWAEQVTRRGRVKLRDPVAMAAETAGLSAQVFLCGHSHLPRITDLPDGRIVVNPGSVGCPAYSDDTPVPHAIETGSPEARFAVLVRDGARWRADLRAVAYDTTRMVACAEGYGRHDWAHAIATGTMPPAPAASVWRPVLRAARAG